MQRKDTTHIKKLLDLTSQSHVLVSKIQMKKLENEPKNASRGKEVLGDFL